MAIALTLLLGIFMGIIFGFTLEKSRVIDPEVIIGQFQLKNFIMLKSSSFLKNGRELTAERSKSQVRELIII